YHFVSPEMARLRPRLARADEHGVLAHFLARQAYRGLDGPGKIRFESHHNSSEDCGKRVAADERRWKTKNGSALTCVDPRPGMGFFGMLLDQSQGVHLGACRNLAVRKHEDILERRLEQLAQKRARARRRHCDHRPVGVLKPLADAIEDVPDLLWR